MICALVAVWYLRSTLDDEIRGQVQGMFAEHYRDLDVRVQEAERIVGKGILIRGLSLSERGAGGPLSELAFFEEIFIACNTDLKELIGGQLDVQQLTMRRPTIRATRRPDGTWSIAKLFPLPNFGGGTPAIGIESATVVIFDPVKNPSGTFTLRDINLMVRRPPGDQPDLDPSRLPFEGSLSGDFVGRVELRGWADTTSGRWSVRGRLDELTISRELQTALPGPIGEALNGVAPFRGEVAVRFNADRDPDREQPYQYDVRGQVLRGRIDDQRLPYALTDVGGSFRIDQNGAVFDEISARSGRTTLLVSGKLVGHGAGSQLQLQGHAKRLVLDRQMVAGMPPDWQEAWNNYLPAGEVDATVNLQYDGQTWRPEVMVECLDVSFTNHRFPYRLQRGRGTVSLQDNELKIRMEALAGNRPVQIEAHIRNPGNQGVGYLVARTSQLPLDDRFYEAMPDNTREVVTSFAPHGSIDGYIRVTRNSPDSRWEHHVIVDLNEIAIQYDKFSYPIRKVRGRLEGVNRQWTFQNLVGTKDNGLVTARGHSVPTADGYMVSMQIEGASVPLDEELRGALSPGMQETWLQLRPRGRVELNCRLNYDSARRDLDLQVGINLGQEGILIEPQFFPYRMENLRGAVTYHDGRAEFSRLTAMHGTTRISSDGFSQHRPDGSWELRLTNLTVDHLRADRELLNALPSRLRSGIATLNFRGPLNMAGTMGFARAAAADAPVRADWDLRLNTFQGRIDCGLQLDQVSGGVRLAGQFDGRHFHSRGWLDVDTLLYKGFHFTELQGPLWLGEDRVLLGAGAEAPQQGQPPRRLTAKLYGGTVAGDCRIALGDTSRFGLNAQLTGGDMARFAAEMMPGTTKLRGDVSANLQLQGTTRGVHTLKGQGAAQLRNGDIYELPLVLSMLKLLSIKSPDSKAFNTSDTQFRIDGNHVLFDQINFYGDAVSLLGKGEMDLERNVRMVFHAIVGNDRLQVPVLRPVLGMASKQLMLIYVHGTLDDPQTTREALPGVRRAVQELQEGFGELETDPTMLNKAKDWLDAIMPGQ